jgi:hypothetical protein
MVTGDHPDVAELVGDALGVDRVFAERTPEEKVEVIKVVRGEGVTAMVGDGINDAPALALADVGIAMGARGATAASEAADVVLTADRLEGLLLAMRIARRTRRIALESVFVGMGLSLNEKASISIGYDQAFVGRTSQNGDALPGSARSTLGSLLIGGSYRFNDKETLNVTLGVGVTRDMPDTTITVRVPITL